MVVILCMDDIAFFYVVRTLFFYNGTNSLKNPFWLHNRTLIGKRTAIKIERSENLPREIIQGFL